MRWTASMTGLLLVAISSWPRAEAWVSVTIPPTPDTSQTVTTDQTTTTSVATPTAGPTTLQASAGTLAAILPNNGRSLTEPSFASYLGGTIVLGANNSGIASGYDSFFASTDGGLTYATTMTSLNLGGMPYLFTSDPVVLVDGNGTFYAAAVGFNGGACQTGPNGIFLTHSTDHGYTWSPVVLIDSAPDDTSPSYVFHDRPWITLDPQANRLWATWNNFAGLSCPLFGAPQIQTSTDSGGSWTRPVSMQSSAVLHTVWPPGNIVALPDGTVLASYFAADAYVFGGSEVDNVHVAQCDPVSCQDIASLPGVAIRGDTYYRLPNLPSVRVNSFPYLARNANTGQLLLTWADYDGNIAHILASESNDGGHTWASPQRVDPVNTDQFEPFPAWGAVPAVCYYRRADETSSTVNVYCTSSSDGGATWNNQILINAAPIDVPSSVPSTYSLWTLGDYMQFDGYRAAFTNVRILSNGTGQSFIDVERACPQCQGDCNGDGAVTVDELQTGTNIALGNVPLGTCPVYDCNGDNEVTVDELLVAVENALNGCLIGRSRFSPAATTTAVALTVGSASGTAGSRVTLPISMSGSGGAAGGVQLDLLFPNILSSPSCTINSRLTGETLSTSLPSSPAAPSGEARLRILIADLQQATAFGDGTLGSCAFTINSGTATGTYTVAGDHVYISDPAGNSLKTTVANGAVTVTAPPPPSGGGGC